MVMMTGTLDKKCEKEYGEGLCSCPCIQYMKEEEWKALGPGDELTSVTESGLSD